MPSRARRGHAVEATAQSLRPRRESIQRHHAGRQRFPTTVVGWPMPCGSSGRRDPYLRGGRTGINVVVSSMVAGSRELARQPRSDCESPQGTYPGVV